MNYTNLSLSTPYALSGIDNCVFLDHYVFKDPVSGYNIFYPLTAYGGPLPTTPPFTFTYTITGGTFQKDCSQDYCFNTITFQPIKIFCVTTVNFVLSSIDQSVSKIGKIIYDFGDGSQQKVVTKDLISNISPANIVVTKTYYPTDQLCTVYVANINVVYDNCCINTYQITFSAFKCGILDVYRKVALLNSQQTKAPYNVLLTLENQDDRQLFNNLLLTNEPFYAIPKQKRLPNLVEPVPVDANIPTSTVVPPVTTQPVDPSPIVAPPPEYIYIGGDGIELIPNTITLTIGDSLTTIDESIILSGAELPYQATPSILITG